MAAESRPVRGGDRTLATAASAAVHALVFGALAWRLGTTPDIPQTRIMDVTLAPPSAAVRTPERRPTRRDAATATSLPRLPEVLTSPLDDRPDAAGVPQYAAEPVPGGEDLRRALRGLTGCARASLLDLTPEERRRCEARLTASADEREPPSKLDLDPRGAFAVEDEPYLARKPKNGCKAMAGGGADPMGKEGPVAGVGCAWSF